ncbi:hypothetical protein C8J57DRAFT_1227851 [Mycena rebaudengoi]|nr:hypothetical protein C8J57DRAFT_1227851 [Mycena rebaudengoi]
MPHCASGQAAPWYPRLHAVGPVKGVIYESILRASSVFEDSTRSGGRNKERRMVESAVAVRGPASTGTRMVLKPQQTEGLPDDNAADQCKLGTGRISILNKQNFLVIRAAARDRCDGSTAPVDGVPCPFRQPFLLDLNATVAVRGWFWSRKDIWVF